MFQKGNKLGGRHPLDPKVRKALDESTLDAVNILIDLMKHGKTEAVKLRATEVFLERSLGKVPQSIFPDEASSGNVTITWEK